MNRRIVPHLFLYVVAVALLGGCAVADYKKPIESLDAAMADSANTIAALDQKLTEIQNEEWRRQIVARQILLEADSDKCALGTGGCSLHALFMDRSTKPYPAASIMPKARLALDALNTYVANLKAITDADTAGKVATSANEALGSLGNIAAMIAKENGKEPATGSITAFKEPASSAIEWMVTRYVDRVKFRALAQATERAHPVIEVLADWYGTAARLAELPELAGAHTKFIESQKKFDDETQALTGARVDAYVAAVVDYDSALKADAARPLEAFKDAHAKLKMQLNGEGGITLADAAAAIERLGKEAKAFKEVIQMFQKALDNQGGN